MTETQIKNIINGMRAHILETCPFKQKIAFLQIYAYKNKSGAVPISIGLGAGWYCTYSESEQAWFRNYVARVTAKYPNIVFDSLCGYAGGRIETPEGIVSMDKMATQMNTTEYLIDKGLL